MNNSWKIFAFLIQRNKLLIKMVNSTSSCAIFIERLTIAFKIIQEPLHIYTMYSIYNIYVVYIIYNTYKNNIYICDIYISILKP